MTHSCVWYDSFTGGTRLFHLYSAWRIFLYGLTHSTCNDWTHSTCNMTYSHVWHYSFMSAGSWRLDLSQRKSHVPHMNDTCDMNSKESLARIHKILAASEKAGVTFELDGRHISVPGYEKVSIFHMTGSDVWHDSFLCVWHDSFICAWHDSFLSVWHDSFICAWQDSFLSVWHDSFICAWLDVFTCGTFKLMCSHVGPLNSKAAMSLCSVLPMSAGLVSVWLWDCGYAACVCVWPRSHSMDEVCKWILVSRECRCLSSLSSGIHHICTYIHT